jgi:hypothetical protein
LLEDHIFFFQAHLLLEGHILFCGRSVQSKKYATKSHQRREEKRREEKRDGSQTNWLECEWGCCHQVAKSTYENWTRVV